MPSQLYATGVDLMWRKQFNDRWGSMIAVRPAVANDFQTSQDAFQLTGPAFATWQWVPERLSLLFGVVYLDRNDIPILPGAGLIWTPTPDWRLDLIFPRPKLARRLAFIPRLREDWVYLGGSLGGWTLGCRTATGRSRSAHAAGLSAVRRPGASRRGRWRYVCRGGIPVRSRTGI